jgi:hypothetical protein
VWAYDDSGSLAIGSAVDGVGWPSGGGGHVKLAAVTMADGAIVEIVDLRGHALLTDAGQRSQAGAVTNIANPSGASAEAVAEKLNELLDELRGAGVIAA